MPGSKWRPHRKIHIYYSNVSGKRSKILEKSGENQGIPSGTKCRNHVKVNSTQKPENNEHTEVVFNNFR